MPDLTASTDVQTLIDNTTPSIFFTDDTTNIQYKNVQILDAEISIFVGAVAVSRTTLL